MVSRAATATRGTTSRRRWPSTMAGRTPRPSGPTTGWCRCNDRRELVNYYVEARGRRGRRRRGRQARHQRVRLRRHGRLAPLADHAATSTSSTRLWPMVQRAIDWVLSPADRAGRDRVGPRGRRHAVGVRAADRLVVDLPLARLRARRLAELRRRRAAATGSWPSRPWPASSAPARGLRAQAPLGHGLVLPGAGQRPAGRRGRASGWPARGSTFVMQGLGVRCVERRAVGDGGGDVGVRAWPTPPPATRPRRPTCCAGPGPTATTTARYWTGIVHPDRVHFPAGERTAYTAAAVILAADAISGASPASGLFLGEACSRSRDELPRRLDEPTALDSRPRSAARRSRAAGRRRRAGERRRTRSDPGAETRLEAAAGQRRAGRSPRTAGGRRRRGRGTRRGWPAGRPGRRAASSRRSRPGPARRRGHRR